MSCVQRLLVVSLTMLTALPVSAGIFGPYEDLRDAEIPTPVGDGWVAQYETTYYSFEKEKWVKDILTITVENWSIEIEIKDARMAGGGFETFDDPDDPEALITTIYGIDVEPDGPLAITGFDSRLVASPASFETIIGASGTHYVSHSTMTVPLGDLATTFPGYDLSIFQGDPSLVVFAFQTTVPVSDLYSVPEVSTGAMLSLAAIGAAGYALYRRRRDTRGRAGSSIAG